MKPLTSAPNGDPLTIQEKAILLYLANSHNEEQRATWGGVLTIAEHMPVFGQLRAGTIQSTIIDRLYEGLLSMTTYSHSSKPATVSSAGSPEYGLVACRHDRLNPARSLLDNQFDP